MSKRTYSVIVFDLGNVLIPFDYKTALKKLNKIDDSLGEKFWKYYTENYKLHRDFERGDVSEEDFVNKMLEVLENKVDRKTFCKLYSEIFTENREVTGLLPVLKKNYLLVLLSNTNMLHMEYGWKDYPFLTYFDKLILSHQVNSVKPEKEIYLAVEKFTRKPSAEHIFIDDVREYVDAAVNLGWDGIKFDNPEQLKAELRSRGIIL